MQGIIRYILLRITNKEYIISGSCNQCGGCCRKINLKTDRGWIRKEDEFLELLEKHQEFKRFTVSGIDRQGFLQFSCSYLDDTGLCKNHADRLDICKNYPAKSLMFCGGQVAEDCGYRIEKVTPFARVLEKECQKRR